MSPVPKKKPTYAQPKQDRAKPKTHADSVKAHPERPYALATVCVNGIYLDARPVSFEYGPDGSPVRATGYATTCGCCGALNEVEYTCLESLIIDCKYCRPAATRRVLKTVEYTKQEIRYPTVTDTNQSGETKTITGPPTITTTNTFTITQTIPDTTPWEESRAIKPDLTDTNDPRPDTDTIVEHNISGATDNPDNPGIIYDKFGIPTKIRDASGNEYTLTPDDEVPPEWEAMLSDKSPNISPTIKKSAKNRK